jgi:hypothetical protein
MDMRNRVTRLRLSRDTCTCSAGASVEQAPSRKPKRERLPKKLKPLGKPEDTQTWARKTGRKRYWQRSGLMAGEQARTEDWKTLSRLATATASLFFSTMPGRTAGITRQSGEKDTRSRWDSPSHTKSANAHGETASHPQSVSLTHSSGLHSESQ